MALDKMHKAYAIDEVRDLMMAHEKWEHDWATRMEESHLQGQLQGRLEEREDLARKCVREGLPLDTVVRITGLSLEQIQGLS